MRSSLSKQPAASLRSQVTLFFIFALVSQLAFFYQFNFNVLKIIQSMRTGWLDYALAPFVLTGAPEISISSLLILSFFIYRKRQYQKAYLVLAGLIMLTGLEFIMKHTFIHSKVPEELRLGFPWAHGIGALNIETPYSFPSGHSLRTMFFLSALFSWSPAARFKYRNWIIGSFFCIQLIGMNYYGFHWSSEVVGGYWIAWIGFETIKYLAGKE